MSKAQGKKQSNSFFDQLKKADQAKAQKKPFTYEKPVVTPERSKTMGALKSLKAKPS